MRLSELELLKYGHFDGCQLSFPRGDPDLQIVFGANEAGKSTTMAAVGDLLFGFPHSTPYDFRFDPQLLRVGGVVESDEARISCRRKKGRKGTLLDGDEKAIDEAGLIAMLSGYSAESFQRMFSLDHIRLRAGGHAILSAQDDVGQAIFAAGSGLIGVTRILDAIDSEAKAIWTKRAGDRLYYAAQRTWDEARGRQKEAQVKPGAWDDLRKHVERLEAELTLLRDEHRATEQDRNVVERQRRVLPHAVLYRDISGRLEPLAGVPPFPLDAQTVFDQVAMAIAGGEVEARLAAEDLDRAKQLLDALSLDECLDGQHDEIQRLREAKAAVDKGMADLPRRIAQRDSKNDTLSALQRELGWPSEPAKAAAERLPRRVDVAAARALLEEKSTVDAVITDVVEDESAAQRAQRRTQDELDALASPRDLGALTAAVRLARALGDIEQVIFDAKLVLDRRERDLITGLAKLAPWVGTADELRRLPVPAQTESSEAVSASVSTAVAVSQAKRDHQALLNRRDELELARTQLLRGAQAVAAETLRTARNTRDEGWNEIRGALVGGTPLPDPADTTGRFEQRSREADDVADRRYASAQQSARLAAIDDELESNALLVNHKAETVDEAMIAAHAAAALWSARLVPSGLALDPQGYVEWSERQQRALELAGEADLARAVHEEAVSRRDKAAAQLVSDIDALGMPVAASITFHQALQASEAIEQEEAAAAQRRRDSRTKLANAVIAYEDVAAKTAAASKRLSGWSLRWSPAIRSVGLNAEGAPASVRAQLDLLEQLRGEVDEILRLEQRIDAIEADRSELASAVRHLGSACGISIDGRAVEDTLTDLVRASAAAQDAQRTGEDLRARIKVATGRLEDSVGAQARALARLQPLFDLAGTTDRAQLLSTVRGADEARRLRAEMLRLSQEVLTAGGGPALDLLLAEVEATESAELETRSGDLQEKASSLGDRIAVLTGEHAAARSDFARLDAGPNAAIAAADAEQARAEMAVLAESYVRKRAEGALLRAVVARYRAQKQNPLVQRASALFSKLTLGGYAGLLVDAEASRLSGVRNDQAVVPVDAMSDGTVDQLFLALRIAAVEDAVASGAKLPFLADDLFINYDDERAAAGFQVLAELARSTQVLFFTHHRHLLKVAQDALVPVTVSTCQLQ